MLRAGLSWAKGGCSVHCQQTSTVRGLQGVSRESQSTHDQKTQDSQRMLDEPRGSFCDLEQPGRVARKGVSSQGKKKHININKFAGLSRDWVGAKI